MSAPSGCPLVEDGLSDKVFAKCVANQKPKDYQEATWTRKIYALLDPRRDTAAQKVVQNHQPAEAGNDRWRTGQTETAATANAARRGDGPDMTGSGDRAGAEFETRRGRRTVNRHTVLRARGVQLRHRFSNGSAAIRTMKEYFILLESLRARGIRLTKALAAASDDVDVHPNLLAKVHLAPEPSSRSRFYMPINISACRVTNTTM